jgi:cation:H+ antiporter
VEAGVMVLGMGIFLAYVVKDSGREPDHEGTREKARWQDFALIAVSAAGIWACANYNIAAIIALSGLLGVGSEVIALTAVSLGTSLPELVVSVVAMRKGSHEIVVGNVLGSNVFNTFAVMGIPGLIAPLVIPPDVVAFSLPVMLGATLMFAYGTYDREVNRWEGGLLLLLYAYFIFETVMRSL